MRRRAENADSQQHANRRQRQGRKRRLPQRVQGRAKTRFKQDDCECNRAGKIRQRGVIKFNAKPIRSRCKADHQKHQQQRRAEAEGNQARKPRCQNKRGANQRIKVDCVFHFAARAKSPKVSVKAECGEGMAGRKSDITKRRDLSVISRRF